MRPRPLRLRCQSERRSVACPLLEDPLPEIGPEVVSPDETRTHFDVRCWGIGRTDGHVRILAPLVDHGTLLGRTEFLS